MDTQQQLELCLRLVVAAFLSAIVGYNRERQDHSAGLRTHMLVGLGSALFTGLGIFAFGPSEPSRVAAQIVTGIGFLGAGTIFRAKGSDGVRGLTTAAGIWAVSAIGMACGAGYYLVAAVAVILIWFVLVILGRWERWMMRRDKRDRQKQPAESLVAEATKPGPPGPE